jgi:hypothetical protein
VSLDVRPPPGPHLQVTALKKQKCYQAGKCLLAARTHLNKALVGVKWASRLGLQQVSDFGQQHLILGRWRGRSGASFSFLITRLMPRMTRNSTKAMMMRLTVTVMKEP